MWASPQFTASDWRTGKVLPPKSAAREYGNPSPSRQSSMVEASSYSPPSYSRQQSSSRRGEEVSRLAPIVSSSPWQTPAKSERRSECAATPSFSTTPQQRQMNTKPRIIYKALSDASRAHYLLNLATLVHIYRKCRSVERMVLLSRALLRWKGAAEGYRVRYAAKNTTIFSIIGNRINLKHDYRWAIHRWKEALPLLPESTRLRGERMQKLAKLLWKCGRDLYFNDCRQVVGRRFHIWRHQAQRQQHVSLEVSLRERIQEYEELMLELSSKVERELISTGQVGSVFDLARGVRVQHAVQAVQTAQAESKSDGQQVPARKPRPYVWPHPGSTPGRQQVFNARGEPVVRQTLSLLEGTDGWSLWS